MDCPHIVASAYTTKKDDYICVGNWVQQGGGTHVRAHRTYQEEQIYDAWPQQRRCAGGAQQVLTLLEYKHCMMCFFFCFM
jgi:hypothetical protein